MTGHKHLSEKSFTPSPFIQFDTWYKDHLSYGTHIPDSVSLGTVSSDGQVSVRTILLKGYDEDGFIFFTNYNSKKGAHLASNNKAALLFYWPEAGRQVRIEGTAGKLSPEESESYFKTRPRESQLAAWASEQSFEIPNRFHLERKYDFYKDMFSGRSVERPPHWGGFRIIPIWFEFWQNGEYRLHDRITYTRSKDSWIIGRLAP
jgi:pyridoxamine 5'-phosphate oxidase